MDNNRYTIPFPFPYKELVIREENFLHPSFIHGVGHTYRVMMLSAVLADKLGWSDLCQEVIWAAALHDTQRQHDGEDKKHGLMAAQKNIPVYLEKMKQQGMQPNAIEAVAFAMTQHSFPQEPSVNHPYYRTAAVLKEADALDRVRMNGLDKSFLRFEDKVHSTALSYALFEQLLNHVVAWGGEDYRPIAEATWEWITLQNASLVEYMDDCKSRFGESVPQEFFRILNDAAFYVDFLDIHAV